MLDKNVAVSVLNTQALARAKINAENFKKGIDKKLKYGESKCARYVKKALITGGASANNSEIESAKNYGPWLLENNFKIVDNATTVRTDGVFTISGQQVGDVVVIQAAPHHVHGHMAMFNGTHWVSDFVQERGFYPAQIYRDQSIPYALYRYGDNTTSEQNASATQKRKIKIVWPIPSNSGGKEFSNLETILAHLGGESTGQYAIGRSGMWHGGIHITHATTPWCALSGKSPLEAIDFPVPFKGEQAVRCMADGEVVAYRVCKDYLTLGWESGPLSFSGSFVLVKHYIQPGEKESSGLHFYTLYMHLAPYSAYESAKKIHWITQDTLSGYSEADWLIMDLSRSDQRPASAGNVNKGTPVTWDASDTSLTATQGGRTYGLATLNADSGKLKTGQKVWMLVDNNNIKPAPGSGPGWWDHLVPPAKEVMVFDKTVSLSSPLPIKAGDSIGHMGYYQAPKDGGHEARYQVHIECTSMDDNLEKFLTNPEKVGEKNPLWLKYSPGLALYTKDVAKGTFSKGATSTTRTGLLPLNTVTAETDKSTKQEYWHLRPENAYVPKGQAEPQLLSQYDLVKLGFRTETVEPASFDYLDGKNQPVGFFRSLINALYEAATGDTRTSHALVKHNYQRLLDKIDSGSDRYSPMEYWRALHNPDYRDVVQKTIVKHPSDWYFKKGDAIWQLFLNALKKDAPEWKKYSEDFLDKMAWMQDVTTEKLGPSLWHMHPIMFLGALKPRNDIDWSKLTKQQFTDAVYEAALKEQEKSGIPAAITTAQAIDESGYGRKVPVDLNNKTYSFNLFGIKAKSGQEFVEIWTTEHINGSNIKIKDKFAAYNSFEESIADRTRFLTENKRYASLFENDDPEKWAHGLQDKGYATDPNYASKLISIMKGSYMKSRGLK
ncbi:glucosaminidase domain-containing protein [Enterobacter roggenkampii]|nr:glucosaminidase domain-containing protein [Enterobacter roggenkampii]EKY3981164.1 glucosaminidase domain-containing protein [Enterobacter roggenkampii]MBF9818273.1 glucosaminidase domain-containing protein [Enterobacter roggenkampii]MCM7724060.1 glucosaminidase domain-containing protein [Enterobacter roggenkampii]MDK4549552.1 glucosaminidase domain-containing protein [Enterobacter roggenkampii]MDX7036118.1 glucosaminidase domain-containing protein [Enterobacter roggenkampii]